MASYKKTEQNTDSIIRELENRFPARFSDGKAAFPAPLLIAIDGRCASGKTTLARELGAELERRSGSSVAVFHMDDFYLRPEQRTKERYAEPGGNVDRERFLSEVLLPLSRGEAFAYRPLICPAMELGAPVCVERPDIAIVEGSYSQHPDLRGYMDLTVFLTLPPAVQRKRILARNGVEKLAVFIERWIPLEEKYFSSLGVEKAADIVLDG